MSANLDLILGSLSKVKKAGKGYMACCPAHNDKSPSLSVSETSEGKVLVHCWVGCETKAVMKAIGLEMRHLFADSLTPEERLRYERDKLEDRRIYLEAVASIISNTAVELSTDDLVFAYDAMEELKRINVALAPRAMPWNFAGPFSSIPYEPPPPAYCGDWLRKGSYTIVFARAGVGKTAICADLVYSLKKQRSWMGMSCTDPGRIAWVNGDMPMWQVNERLAQLKGVTDVDLINIDGPNMMEYQEELVELSRNYDVMLLDNHSALFDLGDSNAAENWRAYNQLIKRIINTGCAAVVQAHEGKGDGASAFGSSAQEWPAHTIIRLYRKEIKLDEAMKCPGCKSTNVRIASWVKCRMGVQPDDVIFQLITDEMGFLNTDIEPFYDRFGDSRLKEKKP